MRRSIKSLTVTTHGSNPLLKNAATISRSQFVPCMAVLAHTHFFAQNPHTELPTTRQQRVLRRRRQEAQSPHRSRHRATRHVLLSVEPRGNPHLFDVLDVVGEFGERQRRGFPLFAKLQRRPRQQDRFALSNSDGSIGVRRADHCRGDPVVAAGAEQRLADGLVDLENPSERLIEEKTDGVHRGRQLDVRAAVAREAHFEESGDQAAVGTVVASEHAVLLDQREDVAEGALQKREIHGGRVVAEDSEGLSERRTAQRERGGAAEIDEEKLAAENRVLDVRSHQVGDLLAVRERGGHQSEGSLE